ncbi:CBS domain-containing protein [candidate division FCPU426 bacterium]|nr:CBS domain-containing protein [candidate division FCPU426 bacterium]
MELILTHINADFDALASAVAAQKLYPQARLFFPGSKERNVREFCALYPDSIPRPLKAKQCLSGKITRLILVDVNSPDRLGEFETLLQDSRLEIVRFDHHENPWAGIPIAHSVVKGYGANTSIMMEELRARRIAITGREATLFALGIYEETGNLTYTSTRAEDLESAAYLVRQGADLTVVNEFIRSWLSREQQALLDDLIKSRETLAVNGLDISFVTAERERFIEDLAVLVNRIKEIERLPVLFALCRMGKRTYMIARSSLESVDVAHVAAALGGGGHATAAAGVVKGAGPPEVKETILSLLHQYLEPMLAAKAIMSSPVITVSATESIAAARSLMMRFGHSGLPVMEKERMIGMITLRDLDKALHHGLDKSEVRQFMSSRLVGAGPEESILHIQRLMSEKNIHHIPVKSKDRLLGIITRADMIKHLGRKTLYTTPREYTGALSVRPPDRAAMRRLMQELLPDRIIGLLHTAGEAADQMGCKAYVVGGFVRDILLRTENWDVDIVVEGDGIAFAGLLARRLGGNSKPHERFQTAKIKCRGELTVDIATARTEYYSRPAALPQVEAASIKYDLFRRDFTINTMAVQINSADFGRLVDYFGGFDDLREGYIRALYAVSFVDDPTRIFRAARFEQRYHFHIEEDTARYIENALKLDLGSRLSLPRIFDELMLILAEEQPLKTLARLEALGVLTWIHPTLKKTGDYARIFSDLWETFAFAVLFVNEKVDRQSMYLMALLDRLTCSQTAQLCKKYQCPRRITELLLKQKNQGEPALRTIASMKKARPSRIVAALRNLPVEVLLYAMAKAGFGTRVAKHIRDYLTRWRYLQPILGGRDLKKMGYTPGPVFERMLNALRARRVDGYLASRQDEVSFLRKKYPLPSSPG